MKMKRSSFLLLIAFILAAMMVSGTVTHAQDQKPGEYQVKTAFLYNFAKFVEWPMERTAPPSVPILLQILGEDPFEAALDGIQEKTIRGRKLVVKRIKSMKNLREGNILFICASEKNRLSQILEELKGSNILTVGDTEGFAERGVMINLYLEQRKVRFEVNLEAMKRAGLKASSHLLKLGKIVHEGS